MTNEENNKIDYPPNYLRSEVDLPPITNKESEEQIMAIQKYIIDKSDLSALLKGEELAIQPRGNIRGFCVEIAGNVTNGDIITALFGKPELEGRTGLIYDFKRLNGKRLFSTYFDKDWWNAPYKAESEVEE